MQGNIIGQDISGNSSLLSNINIFAQPNEPSEKKRYMGTNTHRL